MRSACATSNSRHAEAHPRADRRRRGEPAAWDLAASAREDRPSDRAMKPRPFDYARPDTVEEAVAILAEHGDEARVLAGGQTLLAMLNLRVVEPAILLDITRIPRARCHSRDRRPDRGRRRGHSEPAAGVACARAQASAAGGGTALRRPFPDPQQGHGLRLRRACRSHLGNPAVARRARGRGGVALAPRHPRSCCRRIPAGHAGDRARGR